jgi:POT family proton-dependent oligopeptide transporter
MTEKGKLMAYDFDNQPQLFGHPVGLYVLFFTEMWERFSYYGMRAILTLYMIAKVTDANPGLGWDEAAALSLYGWYTMLVYVASIPGGILADKYIGQKRSVMLGGLILVAGHTVLAVDAIWAFFTGLGLIIAGVGCLKPNISTMVGGLYKQGDLRRDQGFTIFYIGINVGAFLSAIIVGVVAKEYGWHYGFGLAGIGMALGQIVFMIGQKYLRGVGESPKTMAAAAGEDAEETTSMGTLFKKLLRSPIQLAITIALAVGGIALFYFTTEGYNRIGYSLLSAFLAVVIGLLMMIYQDINKIEKDRYVVLLLSFLIVIVFWGAFEQAGGLMNIYTLKKINRVVSMTTMDVCFYGAGVFLLLLGAWKLRKKEDTAYIYLPIGAFLIGLYIYLRGNVLSDPYEIPTAVFQSVNAMFIIIFGTVVGAFWIWWAKLGKEASSLFKMALGTIIMGVGFLWMAKASVDVVKYGDKAALIFLILAYLFHTLGELCASPVALSFITKVAPVKYVSIMMGVYFAATGLGNKVAGVIGEASQLHPVHIELTTQPAEIVDTYELTIQPSQKEGTVALTETTLPENDNFEIVGEVALAGSGIQLTQGSRDLMQHVSIDEENTELLKEYLEGYEHSPSEPLTAILSLEKSTNGDVSWDGELEVFEVQDNQELWTFISIFIFTALFGLLLIVFLKRLKRLTHGAEDVAAQE